MLNDILSPSAGLAPLFKADQKPINKPYCSAVNVKNSQKKMASDDYFKKVPAGQGILPQEPTLHLPLSQRGAALLSALQLSSQFIANPFVQVAPAPFQRDIANFSPSSLLQPQQSIWHNIDRAIDGAISGILPWKVVQANSLSKVSSGQNATTRTPIIDNRNSYLKSVDNVKKSYPQLYVQASNYLKKMLLEKHGLDIDPDKIWFNRFEYASTSSDSFTGWEHYIKPTESQTLTEKLLKNFGAEDQLNIDELSANAGLYKDGNQADFYGQKNEVRLLPADFLTIVKESDFSNKYLHRLDQFWKTHGNSFRTMSKGMFIARLGEETNPLSEATTTQVINSTLGNIHHLQEMTVDELETKVSSRGPNKISTFDIYGYQATDIFLIHMAEGKIVLYIPTGEQNLLEFDNKQELNSWVIQQAKDPVRRGRLASHFSLYDRQEGHTYAGVDSALAGLGKDEWDEKYINFKPTKVRGDVFSWIAKNAEKRSQKDAKILTTNNDEVFREKLLMNLRPAAEMAGLTTAILPGVGSIVLMGIGVSEAGLGLEQAINGDTKRLRDAGLADILNGGVNTLFGALGSTEGFVEMGAESVEVEPTIRQSADPDNELTGFSAGMQHYQIPKPTVPLRGTFLNRLFRQTVVNGRGLKDIEVKNSIYHQRIIDTWADMETTLRDATSKMQTKEGEEIAAIYLGYKNADELPLSQLKEIKKNLEDLTGRLKWMREEDMAVKWVTICDPKKANTLAYYHFRKNVIALDDTFLEADASARLHYLLHECVHAGVRDQGANVQDYFYLSRGLKDHNLIYRREEQLRLSQNKFKQKDFTGLRKSLPDDYFINKMSATKIEEAVAKFFSDSALKSGVFLKNPDTQSVLMMELGGKIKNVVNSSGKMNLPWENDITQNSLPHSY